MNFQDNLIQWPSATTPDTPRLGLGVIRRQAERVAGMMDAATQALASSVEEEDI